ncbi:hypothetical protein TCAL_15493, partial [Tigriopus californicus]
MPCTGSVTLTIRENGRIISVIAFVTPSIRGAFFLSWRNLVDLDITPPSFPNPPEKLQSFSVSEDPSPHEDPVIPLIHFSSVFNNEDILPPMKGPPMKINLRSDCDIKPTSILVARRVPFALASDAEMEVDKQHKAGIIEPVSWPTSWTSPAIFLPKPSGAGIRLVTDFTALNRF